MYVGRSGNYAQATQDGGEKVGIRIYSRRVHIICNEVELGEEELSK
jgi:hypothetical protein